MSATNYTPIYLYNSGTASNTPLAANLGAGELAINYADGKLFYKDGSAAIQVIGWKTTPTTAGGTGLTSYTSGDLPYYASGSALSKLGIGSANYVLTSSGTAPQYVAQSTLSVGSATNATNVATTDNTSSSSTYYPTLVSATSGNNPITTSSTKLSFVPSTGVFTTIGLSVGGLKLGAGDSSLLKNRLINSGFTINQRGYVSGTALASGFYGHDRWKGGASGGTYTFTQGSSGVPIVITITANSIQQVIEGANIPDGGTFTLSWVGTAQGRINGGSYSSSPLTVTGITAGANTTIEFNTGTLSYPQFETSSYATNFEYRSYREEIVLCQRYYSKSFNLQTTPATGAGRIGDVAYRAVGVGTSYVGTVYVTFPVNMRTTPTITFFNPISANANWYNFNVGADSGAGTATETGERGFVAQNSQVATDSLATPIGIHYTASAEL